MGEPVYFLNYLPKNGIEFKSPFSVEVSSRSHAAAGIMNEFKVDSNCIVNAAGMHPNIKRMLNFPNLVADIAV